MTRILPLATLSLLATLATACKDKGDDTGVADTDTDADTDADSDADADSDTDVDFEAIDGTIEYTSEEGGCDATITFHGTKYEGDCDDCTFDFTVDTAKITRDDGSPDCYYAPTLTFQETDAYSDFTFNFSSYYYGYYYDYYDVLRTGFTYYSEYYGKSWNTYDWLSYYYNSYYYTGFVDFDGAGNTIDWEASTGFVNWYEGCTGEDEYEYGKENFGGDYTGNSTIPCDFQGYMDVWQFQGDGLSIDISVDTIGEDTAFDTAFYVMDGELCYVGGADDSFDCTYPPVDYQCSSLSLNTTGGTTYTVLVYSYDSCTGAEGAYSITLDASAGDPGLTLVDDDAPYALEYTAVGSATLTPASR